jgi:hypothetical protein
MRWKYSIDGSQADDDCTKGHGVTGSNANLMEAEVI